MKTACDCGWITDPNRATRLHYENCPTMRAFRDERASVTGGILTLMSENAALLTENERLRELLSRFTGEYRQVFKSIEDSPNYVWMMLPRELLANIKAALAGGRGEK